ncbi:uroporphyrinogen-III C-methyltransferase [Elizabethkingia sp. JS20170427COW]|uniref:uroporphyrinogen-III C-methyltransferase n=1 Tax=Elizabethkingia sp. JS20170427COW TaxID=2583851 RepID=UPI0011107F18|nr:uroporphyrinogen-III C-methyltransferase [Elizabethkingia sp. JS20170427COW]QCX53568.1 uroporphyrinogen-III C-methyltransferase [Elizabethkingia sp. JS20170427COW]
MLQNVDSPKVFLIGAGSGDPDLLTIKAAKILAKADVILCDRLVSHTILELYASPNAEIIYVGKECSKKQSVPQEFINQLMVEKSLNHSTVVRLKGGCISIFSNVLDELEILTKHQISYEIVPGITAASGASAYAAIPLTARGYAQGVRFLTYYDKEVIPEAYFKDLAKTKDTLVFYMSLGKLSQLVEHLKRQGVSSSKQIAVIEQATTPYQKVYTSSFEDFEEKLAQQKFISPSLVIIGEVVGLHEKFSWLENSSKRGSYFPSVAVKNILSNYEKLNYAV